MKPFPQFCFSSTFFLYPPLPSTKAMCVTSAEPCRASHRFSDALSVAKIQCRLQPLRGAK